jgi:uncharacterized membrane protein
MSPRSPGSAGHFPPDQREAMQTMAKFRRASGVGYATIAAELGVSPATVRTWTAEVQPPVRPRVCDRILDAWAPGLTTREIADKAGVSSLEYVRAVLRRHHQRPVPPPRLLTRDESQLRKRALAILREHGFNDQDIAITLGITRQRAAQLRGDEPPVRTSGVAGVEREADDDLLFDA